MSIRLLVWTEIKKEIQTDFQQKKLDFLRRTVKYWLGSHELNLKLKAQGICEVFFIAKMYIINTVSKPEVCN